MALGGAAYGGQADVGDRVVAIHHLGGVLRRRVRRGSVGVVMERGSNGTLRVNFDAGSVLDVHPADVALLV